MNLGMQLQALLHKARATGALKNDTVGTNRRMSQQAQYRADNRYSFLRGFRNLGVDISPLVSERKPTHPVKTTRVVKQETEKQSATERRKEMLQKWKAAKLERQKAEKKALKPLFKVCRIDNKDDISAAYKSIKGMPIPNKLNKTVVPGMHKSYPI